MITLERRIQAFAALGDIMKDGAAGVSDGPAARFSELIETSVSYNPWFTPANVRRAVEALGRNLSSENLRSWLSRYPQLTGDNKPSRVGVVMAGNIPMAGFHDMLCVLITGNILIARTSSKDEPLMKTIAEVLISLEPSFTGFISLSPGTITGFEMVIATGSDNTSRYFEYYFRNYQSIIRHNRRSIAVIDGTETGKELTLLADDVMSYFGLGCRNVTKLYLPAGYDPGRITPLWSHYETLRSHQKYASNYDHNKAVMIVNRKSFIDTGFLLLCDDPSLNPPMAVLNYGFYDDRQWLENDIRAHREGIQCIAGHNHTPFGLTQYPALWDYADNVDVILFLLKKNHCI